MEKKADRGWAEPHGKPLTADTYHVLRPVEDTRSQQVELDDGPDYVDAWVEENFGSNVACFVRVCCTSFLRWELLRLLYQTRDGVSLRTLADLTGSNPMAASIELQGLASLGIISFRPLGKDTSYHLDTTSPLRSALDAAIRGFTNSQAFQFALVYSIVRANHLQAEPD